jgi:c-di-GMP-related signal transduction protein
MFFSLSHTSHQSTSWHPTALISQRFTLAQANIYRKDKRAHLGLPEQSIFSVKTVTPVTLIVFLILNRLTPNDLYISRTAPLAFKRYILYIYLTNIGPEYFKHALYSPFFSLQNAVCFIMLTCLVPVLFTFYIQNVLKLKK